MKIEVVPINEMTDSREMLEAKPNHFFAVFVYILILILVSALVWSYYGKIDIYIKASGIVRPTEDISLIKNALNGKIETLNFKDGQNINAGDVIYTIESKTIQSSIDTHNTKLNDVQAEINNLNKYRQSIETNSNLFNNTNTNQKKYYTLVEKYLSDINYINKQIEDDKVEIEQQKEKSILVLENAQILNEKNQIELSNLELYGECLDKEENLFSPEDHEYYSKYLDYNIKLVNLKNLKDDLLEESKKKQSLYDSDVIPYSEIEEINKKLSAIDNDISQLKSNEKVYLEQNIQKIKNEIKQSELSIKQAEQTVDSYNNEKESVKLLAEKNKLELLTNIDVEAKSYTEKEKELLSNINELELQKKDSVVTSPITGVFNLHKTLVVGEFIQSGQEIANIIPPSPDKFKIEMAVSNKDISNIKIGQEIKFKVLALPFKEYGFVEGVVNKIAVDAENSPSGNEKYYLVEALINNDPINNYKGELGEIKVGMIVEGQIITDSKRIMTWFLEKINLKD